MLMWAWFSWAVTQGRGTHSPLNVDFGSRGMYPTCLLILLS